MKSNGFRHIAAIVGLAALFVPLLASQAFAHGMAGKDAEFVANNVGPEILPFIYLGAKHMFTGYDHLLFIFGVVFFLYRMQHVALYVTLFSIGHSITLLWGVLGGIQVNAYLVDAVIGLSVVYKAFENLGGFKTVFGIAPNTKIAVLGFGLFHGFGLATKLQDLNPSADGLVTNMISFNVGVELGQLLALSFILVFMLWWRRTASFSRYAVAANALILAAGFALTEYQLTGYFLNQGA
ncbi:MAG: HupE/UreJ family protein [Alphaproteobacteria bacterium]|nr:HupE/UreJ family protein [Alphaproteobacteria bacterium]